MVRWTFIEKRNLTLFAFSTRMFFMGVEYAVIFPSVWLYLKIFHADYWYLGLVLSAYNMMGIVSTALVGHLVDITRKARFTGFIWNLAEIAGNFIYSLPFWVGFPLIGRMVAGFGEGFISAMWGELARVTTTEQRTRYFAILKGSNLLGAALGPAFNLFLKEIDFSIGSWHIDFRTSPGFIMALFWIVVTAMMLFCVFDLSRELMKNPEYELLIEEPPTKLKSEREKKRPEPTSPSKEPEESDEVLENDEPVQSPDAKILSVRQRPQLENKPRKTILSIAKEELENRNELEKSKQYELEDIGSLQDEKDAPEISLARESGPVKLELTSSSDDRKNPFNNFETDSSESEPEEALEVESEAATFKSAFLDMFTKFHVIVLVYLLFFMYVIHTCLQGISPLVSEHMLTWNETQLSLLYTGWGLEIILVLVVVWLIAPKIPDRQILLFAVICGCFSTLSLIVLSYSSPGSDLCLYSYLITVFLAGIGISVCVVVGRSLVSKHTKAQNQGLVHAILTSFNRIAGLSGPIFGGSLFVRMDIMAWMLGFLQVLGLVLLLLAYKKLKVVKKVSH